MDDSSRMPALHQIAKGFPVVGVAPNDPRLTSQRLSYIPNPVISTATTSSPNIIMGPNLSTTIKINPQLTKPPNLFQAHHQQQAQSQTNLDRNGPVGQTGLNNCIRINNNVHQTQQQQQQRIQLQFQSNKQTLQPQSQLQRPAAVANQIATASPVQVPAAVPAPAVTEVAAAAIGTTTQLQSSLAQTQPSSLSSQMQPQLQQQQHSLKSTTYINRNILPQNNNNSSTIATPSRLRNIDLSTEILKPSSLASAAKRRNDREPVVVQRNTSKLSPTNAAVPQRKTNEGIDKATISTNPSSATQSSTQLQTAQTVVAASQPVDNNDQPKRTFLKMKSRPKKNSDKLNSFESNGNSDTDQIGVTRKSQEVPEQNSQGTQNTSNNRDIQTSNGIDSQVSSESVVLSVVSKISEKTNLDLDESSQSTERAPSPDCLQSVNQTCKISPRKAYSDQILTAVGLHAASNEKQVTDKARVLAENKPARDNITPRDKETSVVVNPVKETNVTKPVTRTPKVKSNQTQAQPESFSWETYLALKPAEKAPIEAFNQSVEVPENEFMPGMKLEARDPRSSSMSGGTWCLATIIYKEGLRLRLRFDGSDNMNDFWELVDSVNIRMVGSHPGELLFPPIAFKKNHARYQNFVEKVLSDPDVNIARQEYFKKPPKQPRVNLFKPGMKLEAVDRKNSYLICPATISKVEGSDVEIEFDGWKGGFDYKCKFYSRDLFPVGWCEKTGYYITPPHRWEDILNSKPDSTASTKGSKIEKAAIGSTSPKANVKNLLTPKRRGRPRKSSGTSTPISQKSVSSAKKSESSTPRQKPSPRVDQQRLSSEESVKERQLEPEEVQEYAIDRLSGEDEAQSEIEREKRLQCQRAISIDQWRLEKKQKNKNILEIPKAPGTLEVSKVVDSFMNTSTMSETNSSITSPYYSTQSDDTESSLDQAGSPMLKKIRIETTPQKPNNPTANASKPYMEWSVQDVLNLIKSDEGLIKYSEVFENHEIDGKAFVLLSTEVMINHMGLKIGPVLKINNLIAQVKRYK